MKTMGEKVTTSGVGKKWACQYECSGNEHISLLMLAVTMATSK